MLIDLMAIPKIRMTMGYYAYGHPCKAWILRQFGDRAQNQGTIAIIAHKHMIPNIALSVYLLCRAYRDNQQALDLSWALMLDALEQMEGYLKEAMDYEALAQSESQYFRDWITQMGYNPDNLPNPSDET
ncbi:MAG: hypothetical protein IGR80_03905 [Synechococcales cyanobacterium K44_A2020_017]|nr:hypothetical protein [Synechococcales cyanobacterium K44_A2020_017]